MLLDAVSRELIAVEQTSAGAFIKTPLNYPGGTGVVVQVGEADGNRYFISDFGFGLEQAELMGVGRSAFAKYAHAIADSTGTRFDNHAFFVMEVDEDQVAGGVVAVANASQAAVIHTAMRLADKTDQTDAMLFERLQTIFKVRPEIRLVQRAKIVGYSTTPWHVDALVQSRTKQTIFESVSKHPVSIASATTKFYDIARLQDAPSRVAVVRNKRDLGTYLGVLSQAADVIEDSAPSDAIIRLAA